MGPVVAEIEVEATREAAFELISDLGRRPSFTDQFLTGFHLTRIDARGVGAGARFRVKAPLRSPWMDTTIVEQEEPFKIVEQGFGGRINRIRSHTVWELTGGTGVGAAIDFVGAEASTQFGVRALGRGGRLIVVGLFGGTFSMPLPMFAFTGCQIMGSVTGSPAEMKEMMDLVTSGKVTPVPIIKRKLDEADATLQELRKGLIMGRAVLVP